MKKILFLVEFLAVAAAVQSKAGKVKSSFVFGPVVSSYDRFVKYCNEAYDVKIVETLCAKDFNADAAVLVRDVPFDKVSGLGWKYKTCTRVYVKKTGRPMLTMTIVLKDMPDAQRRAYVAKVAKSISYGASHWKYDLDVVGKLQSKYGF